MSDRDASKPVADTPVAPLPGNEAKTRPTADRPMSTEAATGEKAVSVTTGGAARAAQAAGPGRAGSPAENLARILATRSGDGDKPATATENPASRVADGKTKEAAAKPPAGQRPTGTQQSRAGTGTPDTRRMDFQRLVQSLRLSRGARQSSATMRLDPPTLGRMKVDLRMVGDSVQVRVEAATPEARDLLTARAKELTAALRTHDIVVERFEVITVGAEQETGTPPGAEDVGRQASQAHHREPEGQASRSATGDGGMTEDDAASATAIVVDWDAGPEARLDIRI